MIPIGNINFLCDECPLGKDYILFGIVAVFASTETGNLNTADAIKLVKNISGSADIVKMHMNIPSQQRRSARGKQGGLTAEL